MFVSLVDEMRGVLFEKRFEKHLDNGVTHFGGREEYRAFRKKLLEKDVRQICGRKERRAFRQNGSVYFGGREKWRALCKTPSRKKVRFFSFWKLSILHEK